MFFNKKILILDQDFSPIKEIKADIQGYSAAIQFEYQVSLGISKRMFCRPDSIYELPVYLRMDGKLYKPFVYKEWDSYFELYLYRMRRDNVIKSIDELIDFFILDRGEAIDINGSPTAAVVLDAEERIGVYNDKVIICKDELKRGDIISYKEAKRLIFYPVDHNMQSYSGRARECNHNIAFNFAGNVMWFDVILESQTYDVDTGNVINLPEGKIEVWMQENEESTCVKLEQRFLNTGRAWKVIGIDRARPGLMRLFCELTESNSNDNFELGVADYYAYVKEYSITVNHAQPISITVGNTLQLSVSVQENQTTVTDKTVLYESSDEAIFKISETGLITAITEGNATVTVMLEDDLKVTATAEIIVEAAEITPANYRIELTGNSSLKLGFPRTITAKIFENEAEVSNKSVIWSIRNGDGSNIVKAEIYDTTSTSCEVLAENEDYIGDTIFVVATLADDVTVAQEHEMEIIDVF